MTPDEIRARFSKIWPLVPPASDLDHLLRRLLSDLIEAEKPQRSPAS